MNIMMSRDGSFTIRRNTYTFQALHHHRQYSTLEERRNTFYILYTCRGMHACFPRALLKKLKLYNIFLVFSLHGAVSPAFIHY